LVQESRERKRRFPGASATSAAFAQQPDNLPTESLQTAFKSLSGQKTKTQEAKQSSPSPAQAQMFDVSEEEIGENYESGGLYSESMGSDGFAYGTSETAGDQKRVSSATSSYDTGRK